MVAQVTKNLIAVDDIAAQKDVFQQQRNETIYNVYGFLPAVALTDTANLRALDTAKYTRAEVFTSATAYTEYLFDPAAVAGDEKPDVGDGWWIIAVRN